MTKQPGQWRVEAVYRGVNGTLIQITPNGTYTPDETWPKVGENLSVVKPIKESK
jgi:hypothetical protein